MEKEVEMMNYKEIQKFKLQELKEKLLSYPEKVKELKIEKYTVDKAVKREKENLEFYKINIHNQVFHFFQGKRSNKEERDRKFKEIIRKDGEYLRRIKEIKKLEDKSNLLEIEIEKLNNEAKSISKIIDLACQELNFLSIIKKEEKNEISNHKKIITP